MDINPPLQVLPELGFALGNSGWAWPVAVETQRVFKQTTTGLLELDLTTATTLVDEDDVKAWVFSVDDAVPHFVLAASDHFDTFTFSCAPHAVRSLQGHRIDVPCEPERALLLTPHGSLDDQSTAMSACREQTAQCETLLFPALMAQRADMMRTPPSNEGTLPCLLAAGVFEGSGFQQGQDQRLESCFERAYGPGQLLVVDEDAFFVAHTRPPHMIWARGPGPYDRHRTEPPEPVTALTVHGNAEVTDPTVLAVLGGASTSRPLHGQPPERVVTADALALVNGNTWSTGRRMDGPVTVVCENDVLHRRTLPLLDTGLTTAGFNATIVPFFTYKLPCDAKLVLGEHVSGAVVGTRESGRYWGGNFGSFTPDQGQFIGDVGPLHVQTNAADVAPPDWSYLPSCTLTLNGELPLLRGGACGVHFADDLNADGLLDFIITRHGEMGCGSQSLLLSSPDGWMTAGSWDWEC